MQELASAKVNLFLLQQGLDTTTASGRAMFGMLSVFAEFERAIIVERVNAGLARAKAEQDAGIKRYQRDGRLKKPHGRQRTPVENRIREHLASGMSIRQVQRETGAGSGTVQRIKREMAERPRTEIHLYPHLSGAPRLLLRPSLRSRGNPLFNVGKDTGATIGITIVEPIQWFLRACAGAN